MKNLIYYTVGTENYIDVLKLSLESLNKQQYTGEVLIITPFEEKIRSAINYSGNLLFVAPTEQLAIERVALYKLRLDLFDRLNEYEKAIYVDCDIVWTNSPDKIFNVIENEEFYMSHDPHSFMCNRWWSGEMFDELEKAEINESYIRGLNCGLFAFKTSLVSHLKEIYNSVIQAEKIDCVNEQPFMNVYLYRQGKKLGKKMYNTKLAFQVLHTGAQISTPALVNSFKKYYKGTALHFAGSPGNATQRVAQMSEFI